MEEFSELENRLKYGSENNDIISRMFNFSNERGVNFCVDNILQYATRFNSNATKAKNDADIFKMLNYCSRAISQNKNESYRSLLNEIKELIQDKRFNIVCDKCFYLGGKCFTTYNP